MENKKKSTSPLKAIRAYCLDCSNNQASEIRDCPIPNCPLYDFRFGKNPYTKINLSPEQRKARSERMKKFTKAKVDT